MSYPHDSEPQPVVQDSAERVGTEQDAENGANAGDSSATAPTSAQVMRIMYTLEPFQGNTECGAVSSTSDEVIHTADSAHFPIIPPKPTTPCEEWTGRRTKQGYGISWNAEKGREEVVHRQTWEKANGPIPKGMKVCHACDNPPCRRLGHLWLGTQADNLADMKAKGRDRRNLGGKPFPYTEDQMRLMANTPGTCTAVAAQYGIGKDSILRWRKRFGIFVDGRGKYNRKAPATPIARPA